MPIEIVPFEPGHLEDAARLLSTGYRAGRERTPALPAEYEDADSTLLVLSDFIGSGPGVAAYRRGGMAGFLLSDISFFNGAWTAFSPDLAHAADPVDERETYRLMYAHLSRRWVANGCFKHAVSAPAYDTQAVDAWYSLGFGLTVIDAVRDTAPAPAASMDVDVRRARPTDIDAVMDLDLRLRRHLASAPIFIPLVIEDVATNRHEDWLSDPARALWLAYVDGEAVGFMSCEPPGRRFPVVLRRDERTCGLGHAYTKDAVRGSGIGKALLGHAMTWAKNAGYARCLLDYESANIEGARFWSGQGFVPVVYSLARTVDPRIAWAHREREKADIWRHW